MFGVDHQVVEGISSGVDCKEWGSHFVLGLTTRWWKVLVQGMTIRGGVHT